MNYFNNRRNEEFIFTNVSWDNWQELDDYNYIKNGSIEWAAEANLKVTGKFDFEGYVLPDPNNLVRVYYKFASGGEVEKICLATFFVDYSSVTYTDTLRGLKASGNINASSVLSILENKKMGKPFTVKRKQYAVKEAEKLIQECNLNIKVEVPSAFALTSDLTFKPTDSYLTIINSLLDLAGYKQAYPDVYGTIHLEPLSKEGNKLYFKNDDNSIMYPELVNDSNWMTTPNVVAIVYNTDEYFMIATAKNLDGSRASLHNRGNREITYVEQTANIGEDNKPHLLRKRAEELLKSKSCDIEYIKFEHCYLPMKLWDSCTIDYGDKSWTGLLDNFSINLSPSVKTTSKVKRSLSQDIIVESNTTVYRGE